MRTSAVYACVRVLSETVAQLPFMLYHRTATGRERADVHQLYSLVHDQPNDETTAYMFWETLMASLVLRGNAYAYIERDRMNRVGALWQFPDPSRMTPTRDKTTDTLTYVYRLPTGVAEVYQPAEILHLRGLSGDGTIGYSVLEMAREAIGLSAAAEDFGARMFAGDATPSGILRHPKTLGPGGAENLKKTWKTAHQGKREVAVLEEGMEYQQIGIAPDDAQFLETRIFQIGDIARIFRVPPHLIGELSKATYSNIREQSAEFVKYGLQPWLIRIAQQCNAVLLNERERREYYFEHLTDALMRGAQKERYDGYAVGRQWGWLSANDIRRTENMEPLPDEQGNIYMVPVNMVPADAVSRTPPTAPDAEPPAPEPVPEPEPQPGPEDEDDAE